MNAYYNENDPRAAAWLRELIKAGLIVRGDVDERSIEDVSPADLVGYAQCHFFAGIGGWSYALRLAGWRDDRPVWTGSCPCQPFSAAGKGGGFADDRHLWPAFRHLIQNVRPPVVFGEQVANALPWLDLVSRELETQEYSFGATIIGAHSVGAPHIRQRLYWVAESYSGQRFGRAVAPARNDSGGDDSGRTKGNGVASACCEDGFSKREDSERASGARLGEHGRARLCEQEAARLAGPDGTRGWWRNTDWIWCTDEKYRPVEPGTFPLANGISHRVGRLRGYGNAIVPQVAATFVKAYEAARAAHERPA
jgi:DNA (cytosine-5)-methyltransferase 1